MREMPRSDGSVALYGDNSDDDLVIIEPIVTGFVPVNGGALRCDCGAPLQPWSWRCVAAENIVEIGCARCHRVNAHIRLGTKVHR
jgi:hypothetical protein